jgi:hypothetical protein
MKKKSRKEMLALWGKIWAFCSFLALLLPAMMAGTGTAFASPATPPQVSVLFCLPPLIPCHYKTPTPSPTADPPTPTPTIMPTATPPAGPTPTPTPTSMPSPTPTSMPSPTPTSMPSPTPTLTPTATVTVTVTVTPSPTPSATPTPSGGSQQPTILTAPDAIVLRATEIVGTDAHLSLLPDPLHPVLTFSSTTISNLEISRAIGGVTLTIRASGTAVASGVAIKTSIFYDIATALSSFTDKADLLVLAAGGTVHQLVMTNVVLYIDRSLTSSSLTASGLQVSFS